MRAATLFSEDDKRRISDTIAKVERKTAGEVAVMVVDASDSYPEAQILAGLALGAPAALLVADLAFADSLWAFLPLAASLGAACGLLARFWPPLKRLFCLRGHMERRVWDQALLSFYDRGLHRTRDQTGVLFFLSLFERRIRVLADKGIYEKIDQNTLQAFADRIALDARQGHVAEGLCREIEAMGEILAEHFPVRPDDMNEIADEVIVG